MTKLKELERRLRDEPDNLGLRVSVAGALHETGRRADAVELYRSVAIAYRDQGRPQQAIMVCRSILELAPDDASCQQLLAMLLAGPPAPRASPPPPSPFGREPPALRESPPPRPSPSRLPRPPSPEPEVAELAEPVRRSSDEVTPLPPPLPYHEADPTGSLPRLTPADLPPSLREELARIPEIAGIAAAARQISASLIAASRSAEELQELADEDLAAELDTGRLLRTGAPPGTTGGHVPPPLPPPPPAPRAPSPSALRAPPPYPRAPAPPVDTEVPGTADLTGAASVSDDTDDADGDDDPTLPPPLGPGLRASVTEADPILLPPDLIPRAGVSEDDPTLLPPGPVLRPSVTEDDPTLLPPGPVLRPSLTEDDPMLLPPGPVLRPSVTEDDPTLLSSGPVARAGVSEDDPTLLPSGSIPRPGVSEDRTPSPSSPVPRVHPSEDDPTPLPSSPVPRVHSSEDDKTQPRGLPARARPPLIAPTVATGPLAGAFFTALPPRNRGAVLQRFRRRMVAAGAAVIRPGDTGHGLVIVVRGRLELQAERPGGARVTLGAIEPGEFTGEASLLARTPADVYVIAAADAELLVLAAEDFHDVVASFSGLRAELEAVAARRARDHAPLLRA